MMEEPKPRRPILAAVLTILVMGLGHLYVGEPRKAVGLFLGWLCLVLIALATPVAASFALLFGFLSLVVTLFIVAILSAMRDARRNSPMTPGAYNRWYVYAAVIVLVNLCGSLLIDSAPFKTYYLPAAIMEPALLVGDRVVAQKIDPNEVELERWQVIVYQSKEGNQSVSKVARIVGLPGEVIAITDKKVSIDGVEIDDPWGVFRDNRIFPSAAYIPRQHQQRDQLASFTVPEGSVFLLGDNRDASYDSRFFGPVAQGDIVARVLYVYWSSAGGSAIRFGRIGHDLRS